MEGDSIEENPETSVRVAVRIRPQISRELIEMCEICTHVTPNEPQIWLGKEKPVAFTFDQVFDTNSTQEQIYNTCVRGLVEGCFSGYNATVLAYGQTGSGKTYTMGTGFEPGANIQDLDGIVPRAVNHLFEGIELRKRKSKEKNQLPPEFNITAQFLELYNEDINDLLDETSSGCHGKQIRIHEENGSIQIAGVTSRPVNCVKEAFECLQIGALSRTTASTRMNTQSSRSHAIFTLSIHQTRVACDAHDVETLSAKFHFVDLAGSERLKRTGATGERAKEGISINTGLLCLGNVISALGDTSRKATHIPYRDSKLTRLLQDSLGGNSQTLMIACVSPSDSDYVETMSTLRYANRAKNIKNKVVVNHDSSSHMIASLRKENQELRKELAELKQGKRMIADDGTEYINDVYQENEMLLSEIQNLKTRNKALQEANERLVIRDAQNIISNCPSEMKDIVQTYLIEIESLRVKLLEMEETNSNLRKQNRTSIIPSMNDSDLTSDKIIEDAKREVKKMKAYTKLINNGISRGPDNIANSDSGGSDSDNIDGESQHGCDIADHRRRTRIINRQEVDEQGVDEDDDEDDVDNDDEDDDDADDDGDEDEDEDEEGDYDSNEEENRAAEKAQFELNMLNDDISTKELLIAELEKSQRKMQSLKHHYESKLIQLQNQITEIEKERDQVLQKLTQNGNKPDERTRKVHEDYDRKIRTLQGDVRKLQDAKREHAIAMRNQARYEQQVKRLRNEVNEMKRQKVAVMNKMKEEAGKRRLADLQTTKKIVQLTKQERLKDIRIRNLEAENNRIKQILKRKDAEVRALKIKNKNTTNRMMRQTPTIGSRNIVELPGDNLFNHHAGSMTSEKARRMTRTPQELLFGTN